MTQKDPSVKMFYRLLNYCDSHLMNCYYEMPSLSRKKFEFTARPDGFHKEKPIFLEYKGLAANEWDDLRQAMQRLLVLRHLVILKAFLCISRRNFTP